MSKFFIPKENITDEYLLITSEDVAHITKVLRLKIGDTITCCDGVGYNYAARITEIEKGLVKCSITHKTKVDTEPEISVTLIQGVPKASKMDYIIQKTTELGVFEIYPCEMSRCVAKIDNNKKIERWNKISNEAAKQSGRGIVPCVHTPVNVSGAIDIMKKADIAFAAYECEDTNFLKPVLKNSQTPKKIAFMIGPEGGFDEHEVEEIKKASIPLISLGKRILRTETAGEAVLAMIMYEIGDINQK